jgi:hypothetical protein
VRDDAIVRGRIYVAVFSHDLLVVLLLTVFTPMVIPWHLQETMAW